MATFYLVLGGVVLCLGALGSQIVYTRLIMRRYDKQTRTLLMAQDALLERIMAGDFKLLHHAQIMQQTLNLPEFNTGRMTAAANEAKRHLAGAENQPSRGRPLTDAEVQVES